MQTPYPIGVIHFIGIGGIGMSGIAEVLATQGFAVSGTDLKHGANIERLEKLGCKIHIGHAAENIDSAQVVVVSSAITPDNIELQAAREKHIPVVRRAEMLAELMRLKWSITVAGSHGKTTTTSLIAHILDAADYDPSVINGGIVNAYNSNIRLGAGQWFVAEADESDGSFLQLPATIAVVTNMDPEHMEHYGTVEKLREAFLSFLRKVPFYGFAVMCQDHAEVNAMIGELPNHRVIGYGFQKDAMVRGFNLSVSADGVCFDVQIGDEVISDVALKMYGEHNVLNALGAIAVGFGLGIDTKRIKSALADFGGVKRRFTYIDSVDGIRIIDDYAHHPVEIAATLKGARQALGKQGRILAVMQPHRYSRLKDFFDDFCASLQSADSILVSDVYAAGEAPIEGIGGESLAQALQTAGHGSARFLSDPQALPQAVHEWGRSGDMVICLGAGSVTQWAQALPSELKKLRVGS